MYRFILGSGTGDASLVDRNATDTNVEYNTTYSIFDVKQVDDIKLLKIHKLNWSKNEWKGDWCDSSPLWNKRLRKKFDFYDDDNTNNDNNDDESDEDESEAVRNYFYISYDDFCHVFKYLYICKLINPEGGWTEESFVGTWKKAVVSDIY
jgi:hypothetical protein